MVKTRAPRVINLIRLGNPWMVGHNVNRIVPIHAIQGFLATMFKAGKNLQGVRDLARGKVRVEEFPCFNGWHPSGEQEKVLQESIFAIFAPDRRIFRTRKGGPAEGSLSPVVAGFSTSTGSDDGLGKRMADLLRIARKDDWPERLERLMVPERASDPATATAIALLGGDASAGLRERDDDQESAKVSELEESVAGFVVALIKEIGDARRLRVIQDLGRGLYFGAVWLLVVSPLFSREPRTRQRSDQRLVFVYAGMPPGSPHDPLVLAAARSFQRLIENSWNVLIAEMSHRLTHVRIPSSVRAKDEWEERIRTAVRGLSASQADQLVESLKGIPRRRSGLDEAWCREALEESEFDTTELARRVRSLGANIGFAGPDRGRGLPRFYCETPLLGTLVQGLCSDRSMPFEAFVTALRERFGLVFGPGDDDGVAAHLGAIWGGGEGDELLRQNQEEFRRRLVRAGLARTYSDLHTEVGPRG